MLRSKLSRHTLAFLTILGASIALYVAAQTNHQTIIWGLLVLISAVAILTVLTPS